MNTFSLVMSTTALNSETPAEGVSMVNAVSLLAGSVVFRPVIAAPATSTATQDNGEPGKWKTKINDSKYIFFSLRVHFLDQMFIKHPK